MVSTLLLSKYISFIYILINIQYDVVHMRHALLENEISSFKLKFAFYLIKLLCVCNIFNMLYYCRYHIIIFHIVLNVCFLRQIKVLLLLILLLLLL